MGWGWKGPLQVTLPNPNCVSYTVSQMGYALVKWLGNGGCCQRRFPDGWDSPRAALGKETAETGVLGENKPRPLPCSKEGAGQTWAQCFNSSAGSYKGLPVSEARWLKKCRGKQRQQATKQPGGRTESVNKSNISLPYHVSGTVLPHNPIYFTKEVQRGNQAHCHFLL